MGEMTRGLPQQVADERLVPVRAFASSLPSWAVPVYYRHLRAVVRYRRAGENSKADTAAIYLSLLDVEVVTDERGDLLGIRHTRATHRDDMDRFIAQSGAIARRNDSYARIAQDVATPLDNEVARELSRLAGMSS
jgi:hypothetical protein